MKYSIGLKSICLIGLISFAFGSSAQSFKDKMKAKVPKKDRSAIYECGYVHVPTLAEKASPMRALQKSMGGTATKGSNPDLGTSAISIFYQAHLHPQSIMKYPTKTDGWETCGDAVFAGFTNRSGMGLSSTDGQIMMSNTDGSSQVEIPYSGIGTYFRGFKPEARSPKIVKVNSSDGDALEVTVNPGLPLEIISIDGKAKGEEVVIDGTKDIVIELSNGDADPKSNIHVQLICKLVGTPIIYDVTVTKAKNTVTIPKEAFKNFEGSPSPFSKQNTLIVNRVTENIIEGTPAGAIRTISAYMDWAQVTIGGDLSKGNVMTMGFDTTKNTKIDIGLTTSGEYNFTANKAGPYTSPPIKLMKNVAVASFVVRGNLAAEDISTQGNFLVKTTKWFPELKDSDWQKLVEKLYAQVEEQLETKFEMNILPLEKVVAAEAYKHTKSIKDGATKNFVEVGAGGTKRILTTSGTDVFKDLSISFPGDFVSERLVKELGVDAVLAITIDLNFNFDTEGLDPKISIVAYAPNVSYKTAAQYFSMSANTKAKPLSDSRKYTGGVENVIYQMIKADAFIEGFVSALEQLSEKEDAYPVYQQLWQAKL